MGRPKNVHSRQRGTRETGVSAFKINLQRNNFRFKKIFRHVKLSSPFSMRYKSYKMRAEERRRNERNATQRERRLSKDLNDEQKRPKKKKNGKNDPGSKKTYKKNKIQKPRRA